MSSDVAVIAGLAAEVRGLNAQLKRHEKSVDGIWKAHDEIIARLTNIEARLYTMGNPVDSAVRIATLESKQRNAATFMNAVIAALGVAFASIAALIAGIIQALGGPPRPPQ